jgi:hypothetical protein
LIVTQQSVLFHFKYLQHSLFQILTSQAETETEKGKNQIIEKKEKTINDNLKIKSRAVAIKFYIL